MHCNKDVSLEDGLRSSINYLENIFKNEREIVNLGITGGMDSRLIVDFVNSNIKNKIRLFTNGFPENPDVVVGRMLAQAFDLEHKNNIPNLDQSGKYSEKDIIEKLHIHSFQNEGMFGGWDIKAYRKSGKRIVLTGLVGEILKGYSKQSLNYKLKPKPDDFIPTQGLIDPLGILINREKMAIRIEE
ncbi:MAG: hypothetical protein R3E95_10100 [Thiolinea sp.]